MATSSQEKGGRITGGERAGRNDGSLETGSIFRSICTPPPPPALSASPLHCYCNAAHPTTLGQKPIFRRPHDPAELNLGELKMATKFARVTQRETLRHYWGQSQQNVAVTSQALLGSSLVEAAPGRKSQSLLAAALLRFMLQGQVATTAAALESFWEQVQATWTKR